MVPHLSYLENEKTPEDIIIGDSATEGPTSCCNAGVCTSCAPKLKPEAKEAPGYIYYDP